MFAPNPNEDIPYEYQMLSVLRRFDRIANENARLRALLDEYRELAKTAESRLDTIKEKDKQATKRNAEIKDLQRQLRRQEDKTRKLENKKSELEGRIRMLTEKLAERADIILSLQARVELLESTR